VLKSAKQIAGDSPPSVQDVRKAVDEELGIDRAAKAKETKQRREQEDRERAEPLLWDWLGDLAFTMSDAAQRLATVNEDGWKHLEKDTPYVLQRALAAWRALGDSLAARGAKEDRPPGLAGPWTPCLMPR
jgi:hypothetical protein